MAQLTVRLEDDLARELKVHAEGAGRSVNAWVIAVLRAAVDPEFADSAAERTRGRLARAGLLVTPGPAAVKRPDAERVAAARRAAGTGTPLSDIVRDGR